MGELGFPIEASTIIYCDNQSEIQVVDNPISHNKMMQVKLHAHHLRQLVQEKFFTLVYCTTDDQITNFFINPLLEAKFFKLYDLLGL